MRVNDLCRPIMLVLCAALITAACGGPNNTSPDSASSGDAPPELTDELIRERLVGSAVWEVPDASGIGRPITWHFIQSEPKDVVIVDRQVNGNDATVTLDIRTTSSPRSREKRYLEGRLRTEWHLRRGMVLRRWEIVGTENISMTYKNLPSSTPEPKGSPDNETEKPQQ